MYIKCLDLIGMSRKLALLWTFSSLPMFGLEPYVMRFALKAKMKQLR